VQTLRAVLLNLAEVFQRHCTTITSSCEPAMASNLVRVPCVARIIFKMLCGDSTLSWRSVWSALVCDTSLTKNGGTTGELATSVGGSIREGSFGNTIATSASKVPTSVSRGSRTRQVRGAAPRQYHGSHRPVQVLPPTAASTSPASLPWQAVPRSLSVLSTATPPSSSRSSPLNEHIADGVVSPFTASSPKRSYSGLLPVRYASAPDRQTALRR
jgi:hypothetical protein